MIILDTCAVKALAAGHKALNLLAGDMAHTPGDLLGIPALCLMHVAVAADAERLQRRVLAFSSVVVDPPCTMASATVGTMIRDGYGAPTPATPCTARCRPWLVDCATTTYWS
ncbi:hypothetical protein ACIRF8_31560 [Streptomyces sp. NPDC102406]|uniref:hypothetical protein n=1 Tax=Streptomyces sp. NPDC102406 TaxID=3366171 RepID=UPI0037FC3CC1